MIDEIKEIFENIVIQINTEFSTDLKSGVETFYNLDLEEVLGKSTTDNCLTLEYMGTDFVVRTNQARKKMHQYVVIIAHKRSLEMALWWNENKKDAYIYPTETPTKSYSIGVEFITPMSAPAERFLKTTIGLNIYE